MNLQKRLQGIQDPRSSRGIASRGKNVYNATSHAAHHGGGIQFGRPKGSKTVNRNNLKPKKKVNKFQSAAQRRLSNQFEARYEALHGKRNKG